MRADIRHLTAGYATNTPFLNHCLAAYFRRIADPKGLNLEPMLYQVGLCRESGLQVALLSLVSATI